MFNRLKDVQRLFGIYGAHPELIDSPEHSQATNLSETSIAIVRVNVSLIENAHEHMESVVTSITGGGYDIENFISNILVVNVHDSFKEFLNTLEAQIENNLVSIITTRINGYHGTYGCAKRLHYGVLSTDMEKLLNHLFTLEFGSIENVA